MGIGGGTEGDSEGDKAPPTDLEYEGRKQAQRAASEDVIRGVEEMRAKIRPPKSRVSLTSQLVRTTAEAVA